MSNSKCEIIMDSFYGLNKGERIPFASTGHLLVCKECRTKVRTLSKAEKLVKRPLREIQNFEDDAMTAAIKNASPAWLRKVKPVSMKKWVLCGILMILFFGFGGHLGAKTGNEIYQFWFYMLFAAAVTGYCAVFVAANLDFFIKKIDTNKSI